MKLHRIQAPGGVFHRRAGTMVRFGGDMESLRQLGNTVGMAHEAVLLRLKPLKQGAVRIGHAHPRGAIFTGAARPVVGARHPSSQEIGHELGTVADPEDWNPQLQNLFRIAGRGLIVHAVRPSGKNNALIARLPDLIDRGAVAFDHRIHAVFPHPAGDQLVVLAPEVQDQHRFFLFLRHGFPSFPCVSRPLAPDQFLAAGTVRHHCHRHAELLLDELDIRPAVFRQILIPGDPPDILFPARQYFQHGFRPFEGGGGGGKSRVTVPSIS